jgi:hypothetical protein
MISNGCITRADYSGGRAGPDLHPQPYPADAQPYPLTQTYQLTGSALPSSYPAADWMPTRAFSRNSSIERAPA